MSRALDDLLSAPAVHRGRDLTRILGPGAFRRAVRDGAVVRVTQGYYASPVHASSWWTRCAAALAVYGPDAVVHGRAALYLWGLSDAQPSTATVAVPLTSSVRRGIPGVRTLRTRVETQGFDVQGLRIAEPELALFRAAHELAWSDARALALAALGSPLVAESRVRAILDEYPQLAGRRVVRQALDLRAQGVHSILEYDARRNVLAADDFSRVVYQHVVSVAGRRFRLDAYDPDARLAIEFDGFRYHSESARVEYDKERDTLLASIGIQTVRFTTRQVRSRPEWCVARLREVRATRIGGPDSPRATA